jgi:galactoside O-acetyltransferase
MAWLTADQILDLGFSHVGKNAMLSDKASYYNCQNIRVGDNVRIDDFCVLSAGQGGIEIGNYVHIAVYCSIMGREKIQFCDFSGLSSRVSVYSSSDDYSGAAMTNPTIPPEFTNVEHAEVKLGRHVIVGATSVILPGTNLEEGVAVGALSLIKGEYHAFGIYTGSPAKKISERRRDLLDVEKRLMIQNRSGG